MTVTLRPLTVPDLVVVRPWFEDVDTRRFLGGRDWPARMLALTEAVIGTIFRGALQTAAYRWIALDCADPVGYIDCGVFDRWTVCGAGRAADPEVVSVIDRPAASIALAVDPTRRKAGIGRSMVRAVVDAPEVRHVEVFGAGVEPENVASIRCFEASGFLRQSDEPDWEGMLYLIRDRERDDHADTP